MEELYWFWLCCLMSVGVRTGHRLLEDFENPEEVFKVDFRQLEEKTYLNKKMLRELSEGRNFEKIQKDYHSFIERGFHFVSEISPSYPEKFRHMVDYPMGLFYKGELPENDRPAIAIVGARYCSGHGRVQSERFGKSLAEAGINVISGMALGIDGAAHRGALKARRGAYAVLGCGVDVCYPRENYDIYRKIPECGAIISEYPPGREPYPWQFPMRNRLIAGFADKVLIVEARKNSGSLITADYALEQGKDVLALPGRSEDALSEGCLELIKMGAGLVTDPEEIVEAYLSEARKLKKNNIFLAKNEKLVYSSLCLQPKYVEDVCDELKMDLRTVMTILCRLENMGLVRQIYKNQYVLCL